MPCHHFNDMVVADCVELNTVLNQATTNTPVQPEKKKAPKPLKKLDFNNLRSGRTCYFGPQPKSGAPGTILDRVSNCHVIEMVTWHQRFLFRGCFQNF
ncbi:hypothetical protein QL285_056535 [Trifolium repens]|nr:hypothetical protein QL285_056535 [Trifolium repens]